MTDTTPVVGDVWEKDDWFKLTILAVRGITVRGVFEDGIVYVWTLKEWHDWAAKATKVTQ
jgi:hypothetical protein